MVGRRCMFVEDWCCIVPSELWTSMKATNRPVTCEVCREVRTTAAALRQEDHKMRTYIEAYEQGRMIRFMNHEMQFKAVEERYNKTIGDELEAEKVG